MRDDQRPARVLLFLEAADAAEVERSYHEISQSLMGTPGLVRNELLRDVNEPRRFVVFSEWSSHEAFRGWENGPGHRSATAPLRQYQSAANGRPFGVFVVTAAYS